MLTRFQMRLLPSRTGTRLNRGNEEEGQRAFGHSSQGQERQGFCHGVLCRGLWMGEDCRDGNPCGRTVVGTVVRADGSRGRPCTGKAWAKAANEGCKQGATY